MSGGDAFALLASGGIMTFTAPIPTVTAIAVLLISFGCSNSQANNSEDKRTVAAAAGNELSRTDAVFVENAAAAGRFEVEHATLAESKASSGAVKQFAANLKAAHSPANDELTSIIERRHISMPDWWQRDDRRGSVHSKDDSTTMTKLGGPPTGAPNPTGTSGAMGTVATTGEAKDRALEGTTYPWMQATGAEFDEGFIETQIKAHQDAIALFTEEVKSGTDAELKSFAEKHLPALRDHLREAQDLQRSMQQTK
jgi:putative membrane protein